MPEESYAITHTVSPPLSLPYWFCFQWLSVLSFSSVVQILSFCTCRPRPSDVNLKISSRFLPSPFNILRPFSYICYWKTILKLLFFFSYKQYHTHLCPLPFILFWTNHLTISLFLGWKIYEPLYIVISCYRKAEKNIVGPSCVQINTQNSETAYWNKIFFIV